MLVVEKGTKKKEGSAPSLQSGVYICPNGDRYEGAFIVTEGRIERSGTGTQHFVDGLVYTGQWKNDKMNGKGEFTDTSNRVWCGLFTRKVADGLRLKIS
ncbi:hypothetical protein EMCRGX_G013095 [Ephydatia muelleri]